MSSDNFKFILCRESCHMGKLISAVCPYRIATFQVIMPVPSPSPVLLMGLFFDLTELMQESFQREFLIPVL